MVATDELLALFTETRAHSETICAPLKTEDYVVQPIVDVSPPKWHLGHTTWFFEEFLLKPHYPGYTLFDKNFAFVFNSYYESVGKRVVRTDRGNLSRPTVDQIYAYRTYVTKHMASLIKEHMTSELESVLEIGIHHEKQHQELLLTDIKFILGNNPLLPAYNRAFKENISESHELEWISIEEGMYTIGHQEEDQFCYDNEKGVHKVYLHDVEISNKLVTNQEYLEFIVQGGYQNAMLWHAEAWDWINSNQMKHPLYWHKINDNWHQYTLSGLEPLNLSAPVTHVSYFEAFAFAQWKEMRLPTEFEWEVANGYFNWGQRWEWTESAYSPYPNYTKPEGALGEYNGKFMVNQKVLRGGSVATPSKHTRCTYRNFFQPNLQWQFTGIRLAK
ncbi:ergothioneine biosynthesis protein EgtB [Gangjinia marincola]|uniref:Ergothioneine biosynthesis protein EgtB n=1 Tax=Gangjinia marincola TaxID=578463 RepID=A0ABP3XQ11_9FLAO